MSLPANHDYDIIIGITFFFGLIYVFAYYRSKWQTNRGGESEYVLAFRHCKKVDEPAVEGWGLLLNIICLYG